MKTANLIRIRLEPISKNDPNLRTLASQHYSNPKGFVGRFVAFAIHAEEQFLGVIVGSSATLHLPGRDRFKEDLGGNLNSIINNSLFHIRKPRGWPPFSYHYGPLGLEVSETRRPYPIRNVTSRVLGEWRLQVIASWEKRYGDDVIGFETLVQPPRTGETYRRDGWSLVGRTKGFCCRRVSGRSKNEQFTGKRIWKFDPNSQKLVFNRPV